MNINIRLDHWGFGVNKGRKVIYIGVLDEATSPAEVVKDVFYIASHTGVKCVMIDQNVAMHRNWDYIHSCLSDRELGLQLQLYVDLEQLAENSLESYTRIARRGYQWIAIREPKGVVYPLPFASEIFLIDPPSGKFDHPQKTGVIYHVCGEEEAAEAWIMEQEHPSDWLLGGDK